MRLGFTRIIVVTALAGCGPDVEPAGETETASGSAETTSSADDSSTGPPPTTSSGSPSSSVGSGPTGSETGPPTLCGDGLLDEGEDCDDGNRTDADGCNTDCRISGSLRWSQSLEGAVGAVATGPGIIDAAIARERDDALVFARFDSEGTRIDEDVVDAPPLAAFDFRSLAPLTLGLDPQLRRYATAVWFLTSLGEATEPFGYVTACAPDCKEPWVDTADAVGLYVADRLSDGSLWGFAWSDDMGAVRTYSPTGDVTDGVAVPSAPVSSVALTGDGDAVTCGQTFDTSVAVVSRISLDGNVVWTVADPSGILGRAASLVVDADGTIVVTGEYISPNGTGWLRRFGADGRLLSEREWDRPGADAAGYNVAIDDAGAIVVGSHNGLRKFDRELEPLWHEDVGVASAVAVTEDGDIVAGYRDLMAPFIGRFAP